MTVTLRFNSAGDRFCRRFFRQEIHVRVPTAFPITLLVLTVSFAGTPARAQTPRRRPRRREGRADTVKSAPATERETSGAAALDHLARRANRRPRHPLHGHRRHPAAPGRERQAQGRHLLRRLHARRCRRRAVAADHVLLQRRARARRRCGCTWARSDRSAWTWAPRGSSRRRRIACSTTTARSSTSPTSC